MLKHTILLSIIHVITQFATTSIVTLQDSFFNSLFLETISLVSIRVNIDFSTDSLQSKEAFY